MGYIMIKHGILHCPKVFYFVYPSTPVIVHLKYSFIHVTAILNELVITVGGLPKLWLIGTVLHFLRTDLVDQARGMGKIRRGYGLSLGSIDYSDESA